MKKFYISTPIYYPSGKPHIGHAYSTIVADVLAKYKKNIGYDVFFMTGTDEHGLKIEQKAKELNLTSKELVDINSKVFLDLWDKLGINYSKFIRTSYDYHISTVQKIISNLIAKDYVYLSYWEGYYCVSCEENYSKSNAKKEGDKLFCQHGHPLELKKEESYFLKTKPFKQWIINYLKNNNNIYPTNRVNELLNSFLLNDDFDDLSISRTSFDWGIKILENDKHVVYVWMDALINYISGLGYSQDDQSLYEKFWNDSNCEIIHIMSKEITRFHCIYWPIILEMLNINKPTKYISHGWIITDKGKMSKSLGNVVDPFELIEKYGRDSVRYFLSKEISFKEDSTFSEDFLVQTYNNDLANNFGNLISRVIGMHSKYKNYIVPKFENPTNQLNIEYFNFIKTFDNRIIEKINSLMLQDIIKEITLLFDKSNLLIEEIKPWNLHKNNDIKSLDETLSLLVLALKRVIFYLQPILIDGTKEALTQLNINSDEFNLEYVNNNHNMDNKKLNTSNPIYARIEKK